MDFGRLPDLDGVSFALPPIAEKGRALLDAARAHDASATSGPWLRSGAPAWARKDWVGRLYPRGLSDRRFLAEYAKRVDAIELNASYYRVPTAEVLDAWAAEVPARFRFCPKLHQSITHRRALEESADEALRFGRHFLRLGEKLGPGFLQLPPWLDAGGLRGLDALLAALPVDFRVAVEFRHPSWFDRGELRDDAARVLSRWGAGAVITDVAGRRDVCHGSITAPFVIVRFVGNGLHPTDLPRADAWIERLVELRDLGLHEAYFFAHQPDDALAPELLAHVARRARKRGIDLPPIDLSSGRASDVRPPSDPLGTDAPSRDPSISPPAAQLDLFGLSGASPSARGNRRTRKKT